jgi:glycoside/pentoside/hexuronide:cation symporter, GPH family
VKAVSVGTRVGYGAGAVAVAAKDAAVVHFLAFYYTQVIGLPGWLYGLSAFLAQAIDAFADPILGTLSDNTRSRFGRRHPWMAASALPIGVGFLLLFAPPSEAPGWAVFLWITFVQTALRMLLSVFSIPHTTLGAELSTDYEERTRIASYRTLLAWIVGILLPAGAYAVVFQQTPEGGDGRLVAENYVMYAWASAIAATLAVVWSCASTWRLIPQLPVPKLKRKLDLLDPLRDVQDALRIANFRWIFLATLAIGACTGVTTILGTYTWTYFWEFSTAQAGLITLFSLLPTFFAFVLVRPLGSRFEKKPITLWCMAVIIVNALWLYGGRLLGLLPENGTTAIFALMLLHQSIVVIAVVLWQSIAPSMIADVADEHEVATGERKEGVFFAALAFALKVPTGLGNAIGGFLVAWVGIPALTQPGTVSADALFRLGLAAGPIVAASFLVPLWLFTRFELSRERHAELRRTLEGRGAGG